MNNTEGTTAAPTSATPDPISTENPECVHPWCESGGEGGHRDHASAGFYVSATGEGSPRVVDLDGTRFPMFRVYITAEDDSPAAVSLFIGGLGDSRRIHDVEVATTPAEARELRDALDVLLRHIEKEVGR